MWGNWASLTVIFALYKRWCPCFAQIISTFLCVIFVCPYWFWGALFFCSTRALEISWPAESESRKCRENLGPYPEAGGDPCPAELTSHPWASCRLKLRVLLQVSVCICLLVWHLSFTVLNPYFSAGFFYESFLKQYLHINPHLRICFWGAQDKTSLFLWFQRTDLILEHESGI